MTTNDDSLIRGKVARILTVRELVLNIGRHDGVELDMLFDILDPIAQDIQDPDTKEVIGSLYRPKIRLKITSVEERIALASTYKSTTVNMGGQGGIAALLGASFEAPEWVTQYESLRTRKIPGTALTRKTVL